MAHVEKYYHQYCNKEGIVCRVSVLQDNFAGSAIELEAQPVPFLKQYDNASDFKFEPIRPSTGLCFFAFGTGNGVDFEELWSAKEQEFKVEHYIDGNLDWVGFVIPQAFQYRLKDGLYYGTLRAACGLATLEDIPFADPNTGEPYGTVDLTWNDGFKFQPILILTEILKKLNLNLNTWVAVDLYENTMNKTNTDRTSDPLTQCQFDVRVYINDSQQKDIPYWADQNEVFNCKQVLENMCYQWGAIIHQNKGVWRFKRVNVDADYGSGATQRYWRKYNTAAVYLSREPVNNEILIPCQAITDKYLQGTDHVVRMDDVYGAFRINYKYQFLRIGDNPEALIENGDFSDFQNTSKLAAPAKWTRWRAGNEWHLAMRQQDLTSEKPGGFTSGLLIGRQAAGMSNNRMDFTTHPWNSLRYATQIPMDKGDLVFWNMWLKWKVRAKQGGASNNIFVVLFRITAVLDNGKRFFLRNNTTQAEAGIKGMSWTEDEEDNKTTDDIFFAVSAEMANDTSDIETYIWRQFNFELPAFPDNGRLIFDLHGLAGYLGNTSGNFPPLRTYFAGENPNNIQKWKTPRDGDFVVKGGNVEQLIVTGVELGRIPDAAEQPEQQDYLYENPGYSLEVDPLEVLHGDVLDQQHVSRIIVPSNTGPLKNFWDVIDGQYLPSSLGLAVVRSIMQLYFKPFRILEGLVKTPGVDIDTKFKFDALPGRAFMLSRAAFNEKENLVQEATFFEISSEALPPGGREGNGTLDPQWIRTGRWRCKRDGAFVNTGEIEFQERDMNPNSQTYLQFRWVDGGTDTGACPIGEARRYYWGTDDISLDINNLEFAGYFVDPANTKIISADFTNPGGNYIYFVHLLSLGLVNQVITVGQPEIISDFQYLADINVDGFTYKVLRQNFVTADFTNFTINFEFT